MVWRLFVMVLRVWLGLLLAGCGAPQERMPTPRPWPPRSTRPVVAVTLAPTPLPRPTLSPLQATGAPTEQGGPIEQGGYTEQGGHIEQGGHTGPPLQPWQIASRGALATPAAPVLVDYLSVVSNERCYGDCITAGNTSLLMTDFTPYWEHSDPAAVDTYEVWRATDEAYWTAATCTGCALVGTTTGMTLTVTNSPPAFNPVGGTSGAAIMSAIDFYVVRAVNGAGASDSSNVIGVVHYSLLQGGATDANAFPRPTPTYAP